MQTFWSTFVSFTHNQTFTSQMLAIEDLSRRIDIARSRQMLTIGGIGGTPPLSRRREDIVATHSLPMQTFLRTLVSITRNQTPPSYAESQWYSVATHRVRNQSPQFLHCVSGGEEKLLSGGEEKPLSGGEGVSGGKVCRAKCGV